METGATANRAAMDGKRICQNRTGHCRISEKLLCVAVTGAHATSHCAYGTCTIAANVCEAGWADCDQIEFNGCDCPATMTSVDRLCM